MCGLIVVRDPEGVDPVTLQRATKALGHRGPDDERYLLADTLTGEHRLVSNPHEADLRADLGFGFRRLAIIDPSDAGAQPMSSRGGSTWIVFNGEIYNHLELRRELEVAGARFRSRTDTEVILAAYDAWGPRCVDRFIGMWAFVLWDTASRQLVCSRDRFGIKPLYLTRFGGRFALASECKALLDLPPGERRLDIESVAAFLIQGRIDHRRTTLFAGIDQLPAAVTAVLDLDASGSSNEHRYWAVDPDRTVDLDGTAASTELLHVLDDAVRLQLRADVAIGTCLSGGLDSSTIVALVNRHLRRGGVSAGKLGEHQKTFTACSDDPRFDERRYALAVVEATDAESDLVFPEAEDLARDLDHVLHHQDHPFASTSIYAQWCVFRRAAERGVRVVLDGQGGDELFAGYEGHLVSHLVSLVRRGRLARALTEWLRGIPSGSRIDWMQDQARAAGGWRAGLLNQFASVRHRPPPWIRPEVLTTHSEPSEPARGGGLDQRLLRELNEGLPELLRYEDRNSMAHSVEARVPFLDHRVVELAFAMPSELKIQDGIRKHVLRESVSGLIPETVRTRRDKMGFVTPEHDWLRAALIPQMRETFVSAPPNVRLMLRTDYLNRLVNRLQDGVPLHAVERQGLWRSFIACRWAGVFDLS